MRNHRITRSRFYTILSCLLILNTQLSGYVRSQAPINDECTGAILLSCGDTAEVNPLNWTPSFSSTLINDVFYYMEGNNQNVLIDLCGSSETFFLRLYKYKVSCGSIKSCFGQMEAMEECNFGGTYIQKRRFYAAGDWNYLIAVDGYDFPNELAELHVSCEGEPVLGCNETTACNYAPDGDWLNLCCSWVDCDTCQEGYGLLQISIPGPIVIDDSGNCDANFPFTLVNEANEIVLEEENSCQDFLENNGLIYSISGAYYMVKTYCLPIGCYTIVFEFVDSYINLTLPWMLSLPENPNIESGTHGDSAFFCVDYIHGCQDPGALNFNPFAQAPDICLYPGDFNEDGIINIEDLLILIQFHGCIDQCVLYDLNEDDIVNVTDLMLLMNLLNE